MDRVQNKTDCHDKTAILFKVALNTITLTPIQKTKVGPKELV
jgi:hypothetical protein